MDHRPPVAMGFVARACPEESGGALTVGKDPWVRELHRSERPAAHVVLFPHAGGAATFYVPFARRFPREFDLSAIQYPGRQERLDEPLIPTIEGLAGQVLRALRQYADRPVPLVLFGHSMGASVAFETSLRLAAEGAAPQHLVVSGRPAPSAQPEPRAYGRSDQEILEDVATLGGTDAQIIHNPDLLDLLLPAIRNDFGAVERYRPAGHAVLDVPVLCLTGEQDPRVTYEQAAAWKAHTSADFRLKTFPGGHFFLTEHPEAVARLVTGCAGFAAGNGNTAQDV